MPQEPIPPSSADAQLGGLNLPKFELGKRPLFSSPPFQGVPRHDKRVTENAHTHVPTHHHTEEPQTVEPVHVHRHEHDEPRSHDHDHEHECSHGHDHADHEHHHDHDLSPSHDHASHDHGHHHHGPGGCDHKHGLFDGHHHDYSHMATTAANRKILKTALVIQMAFLMTEIAGGMAYNSLALLSDAAHMLADVGAFALALFAASMAMRPTSHKRTYGLTRAETLAALLNCISLLLASVWIIFEAMQRFASPEAVEGGGVMTIAAVGVFANIATALVLIRGDRENLNIRATLTHTVIDAVSCVGVLISGFVVAATGFAYADTIASLLIAFLAIKGTLPILRNAIDSLLDAAPEGLDGHMIEAALREHEHVVDVSNVRVWSIGQNLHAMSAHVDCQSSCEISELIEDLQHRMRRLGISHATVQVAPVRSLVVPPRQHQYHQPVHSNEHSKLTEAN